MGDDLIPFPRAKRPDWYRTLRLKPRGRPYPDLDNVLIALRGEPITTNAFALGRGRDAIVVLNHLTLPPFNLKGGQEPPRWLGDYDISVLQCWLQGTFPMLGRRVIERAVRILAEERGHA
jgi:hypothetical protein